MHAIIIFYNQGESKLNSWFLHPDFQHVDAFFYQYEGWWVNRLTHRGLTLKKSSFDHGLDIINKATTLATTTHIIMMDICWTSNRIVVPPYIITCNEIARYITKVNIGFTLTPYHFYSKLIKYDHKPS